MSRYDDMLHLPHHVSPTRSRMSRSDRAAQFAPFAALTGYDAAIAETARLTDAKPEPDEAQNAALNRKLQILLTCAPVHPELTVLWFRADEKKPGGAYVTTTGQFLKIDPYQQTVCLSNTDPIPMDQIIDLESRIFPEDGWNTDLSFA